MCKIKPHCNFVLRSFKSLAELVYLSAFPSCYGVVTVFLALSYSRLFSSMLFAARGLLESLYAFLAVTEPILYQIMDICGVRHHLKAWAAAVENDLTEHCE